MAVRTRFLQIGVALVNIAIIGLVFTSIWPFPSGEFKVDLPNSNDVTWSYDQNGTVSVVAPFTIHNGWIYDVNDLVVEYSVTNSSHILLGHDTLLLGTIPANQITQSQIDFSFDLLGFYTNGGLGMVFRDDTLNLSISVSCLYTMKLIEFDASYTASVPWYALIMSYGANYTTPTPTTFDINYYIETAPILARLGTVKATVSIFNATNGLVYPPFTPDVRLGELYRGTLAFTPTLPSGVPAYATINLLGFQFRMDLPYG